MKSLLSILALIGLAYLLVTVFYALMQRSVMYYPVTVPLEQARSMVAAMGGEPWLSQDGQWQGWFKALGQSADGVVKSRAVVFHGNAGMALNRDYYANLLSGFEQSGPWTVFVFEYPGYGPRPGSPSEATFTSAALAAVDELLSEQSTPLLAIGESIGGGVASAVAQERADALSALLRVTPFDSMVHLAHHHLPYLPAGLLLKDRYENSSALRDFDQPLIIVTAGNDRIVPASFADPLMEQHAGPLLRQLQPNAGHNSLSFDPAHPTWTEVDRFLVNSISKEGLQ
ncbi:MAG: alpha/beta fold hydrolase [Pseudomonadota bacterium]